MPPKIIEADTTGDSLEQQEDQVRTAWQEDCKASMPGQSWDSWPVETYEDHVIVRMGEDFWSVPYSRADTEGDGLSDDIVFDRESATKVSRQWIAVEAVDWLVRPLTEAADAEPDGSKWEAIIIHSGKSKNRRKYSEAVLQKATPLFEGVRVMERSDDDHLVQADKRVKNIVGWIEAVSYSKKAIRGTFRVTAPWLKELLLEGWKNGKKDLVGLSIVAAGKGKAVREGSQQFIEVEEITAVSSVDVVFDPAAGGGLVKLVAAVKEGGAPDMPLADVTTLEQLKDADPALYDKLLAEAVKTDAPKPDPVVVPEKTEKDQEDDDLVPKSISRMVVNQALAETKLPELVKAKIAKQFTGTSFKVDLLEAAVKDELDLWAELEKGQIVRSGGETKDGPAEVGIEEAERAKAALDGFFAQEAVELDGEKIRPFRSFREAYVALTGDTRVSGHLPKRPSGALGISAANGGKVSIRLHEMDDDHQFVLSEAVTVAGFDQILGDSVARRMLAEYQQSNLRAAWEPIVDIVPLNDVRTQRRMRFGGYLNLATVTAGSAYAAMTSPTDEEATYTPAKKGGTETINLEAILNDDVQFIRRIPTRMARAAAQTLHEFVLDFMRANGNIYDGTALAVAGHGSNISTVALSVAQLSVARLTMIKQQDMSSSKPIGLTPAHLYVPPELEQTAFELTNSGQKPYTADNESNFVKALSLDYFVIAYWTDTNNYWVVSSKDQTPLIELGFVYGEEPELFTQDLPNVGTMFTNDQLTYKIRHWYGGAVMDFRGFFGGIVA
jgi:hypothetical protein